MERNLQATPQANDRTQQQFNPSPFLFMFRLTKFPAIPDSNFA